jgi:hypothetical protein
MRRLIGRLLCWFLDAAPPAVLAWPANRYALPPPTARASAWLDWSDDPEALVRPSDPPGQPDRTVQ